MKDALKIVTITVSEVTVSWSPYRLPTAADGTRSPHIEVTSYDVEVTMNDQDWTVVGSLEPSQQSDQDAYTYRVRRLVPGTRYRFRLVIVWQNGNKPTRSVPGPPTTWTRTHCGQSAFCYYRIG